MGRKAKPLQEQVDLLVKRGMTIRDPEKARRLLLEIGWYRMSLYWFPFETRYPDRMNPEHKFRQGTLFEDALLLYAFDFNLRNALLKPLERIETAFRTYMIYAVSTRYPDRPEWFADPKVVNASQAYQFERSVYTTLKRIQPEIQLHHRRFPKDRFAPAWKTLEFMTLGGICTLFDSLNSDSLRLDIARHFGVHSLDVFCSYMSVIRTLRNLCAHGSILYSYRPEPIPRGPALGGTSVPQRNLRGALAVVEHFLSVISKRLQKELNSEIKQLAADFSRSPGTAKVLRHTSGFRL